MRIYLLLESFDEASHNSRAVCKLALYSWATDWKGKWALSANHLDGKNPIPKIWQLWTGAWLITDALKDTDYPSPPKKGWATP